MWKGNQHTGSAAWLFLEEVFSAIKVMNEAGVNHILVTGEKTKPLGIISSLEVVKLVAAQAS